MIDYDPERPIWRQLAADIRGRAALGELAPGQRLPSEADLMHAYGVSRTTVRRALAELRAAGVVEVQQRPGAPRAHYVADPDSAPVVTLAPGDRAETAGGTVTVTRAGGATEVYRGAVRLAREEG